MRPFTLILIIALGLVVGCTRDEAQEAGEPAPTATEAPAVAEAPAASEAPAAAGGHCARVTECCGAMGDQFGGGAQTRCREVSGANDDAACLTYLNTNSQINSADGHPLQGQMPAACMPD